MDQDLLSCLIISMINTCANCTQANVPQIRNLVKSIRRKISSDSIQNLWQRKCFDISVFHQPLRASRSGIRRDFHVSLRDLYNIAKDVRFFADLKQYFQMFHETLHNFEAWAVSRYENCEMFKFDGVKMFDQPVGVMLRWYPSELSCRFQT
jgi:hypothetical protein